MEWFSTMWVERHVVCRHEPYHNKRNRATESEILVFKVMLPMIVPLHEILYFYNISSLKKGKP